MWIFFGLLSPAIYAISNFIDKYLLTRKVKDYNALTIYSATVGFLFGTCWWVISGFPLLPFKDAVIIIITGIITICSFVVYLKALSVEDTSSINLLFQLIPLFTLILSTLFLKESITSRQYIGFAVILTATGFFALQTKHKKWHFPIGFWLIMLYDIMFAIIGVMLKYVSRNSSFSQIISYESFGMGIGGILVYFFIPTIRNAFLKSREELFKKALPVIVLNEVVFIMAKSLGYYAFVIGPVTLVSVLSNVQVFFAILLGWILTRLYPQTFHENISKKTMLLKIFCAVLLFIGVYLML